MLAAKQQGLWSTQAVPFPKTCQTQSHAQSDVVSFGQGQSGYCKGTVAQWQACTVSMIRAVGRGMCSVIKDFTQHMGIWNGGYSAHRWQRPLP